MSGPKSWTDAEKCSIVEGWKLSGSAIEPYAKSVGVPASNLYRWSKTHANGLPTKKKGGPQKGSRKKHTPGPSADGGRTYRSDDEKRRYAEAWNAIGDSRTFQAFCAENRVAPGNLRKWARQLGIELRARENGKPWTKPGAQMQLAAEGAAVISKQVAPRAEVDGLEGATLEAAFSGNREDKYRELMHILQGLPDPRHRVRAIACMDELLS